MSFQKLIDNLRDFQVEQTCHNENLESAIKIIEELSFFVIQCPCNCYIQNEPTEKCDRCKCLDLI